MFSNLAGFCFSTFLDVRELTLEAGSKFSNRSNTPSACESDRHQRGQLLQRGGGWEILMEVVVTPQTGRVAGRRVIRGRALHCEGHVEGQLEATRVLDLFFRIECPGSFAPTMPCTSGGQVSLRKCRAAALTVWGVRQEGEGETSRWRQVGRGVMTQAQAPWHPATGGGPWWAGHSTTLGGWPASHRWSLPVLVSSLLPSNSLL